MDPYVIRQEEYQQMSPYERYKFVLKQYSNEPEIKEALIKQWPLGGINFVDPFKGIHYVIINPAGKVLS